MEKTQAEATADAVLEPRLRAQQARSEEIPAKHATEHALLARKRRVAWFLLAGSAIGVVVAHFTGFRFSLGVIWGGLAGSALGWLLTRRAA